MSSLRIFNENRLFLVLSVFFLLLSPIEVSAAINGLNGVWNCDDNGKYYIVQSGENVYWYGEQKPLNPDWANLAIGKRNGNVITLTWFDLPKGKMKQNGKLTLTFSETRSSDTFQTLTAISKTGNFGGSKWTRILLG